jgi:hypothetical protein
VNAVEARNDVQQNDLNGNHVGLLVSHLRDYESGTWVNRELSSVLEDVCCTLESLSSHLGEAIPRQTKAEVSDSPTVSLPSTCLFITLS